MRIKLVNSKLFYKTKENLIPIVSTNLELNDEEIIDIYKRRWDIEQGYKELREHFGFGKEENRIYEALVAKSHAIIFYIQYSQLYKSYQ